MQKKFHQKAFTLIEMLIVIVIIWVLAAALIPRLTSVRDRANDVARKADLNQISTAIIARQMDHNWTLPGVNTGHVQNADSISAQLKDAWLDSVPQDPKVDAVIDWLWVEWVTTTSWQYGYLKIQKNGIANSAFVVMAKMETPGASNRLFHAWNQSWRVLSTQETSDFTPCKTITKSGEFLLVPGWACLFTWYDQLRYFIIR